MGSTHATTSQIKSKKGVNMIVTYVLGVKVLCVFWGGGGGGGGTHFYT